MADLLFEIGAEEMPAAAVDSGLSQLRERAERLLVENRIIGDERPATIRAYGTPRRLALVVEGLAEEQAPMIQEIKGPPKKAAFNEAGEPTPAAGGFARSQGVTVEELVTKEEGGREYVFVVKELPGRRARDILPGLLSELALSLDFPKTMRWGTGELRFIRPIRWLVALLDGEVLPFDLDGLATGRVTYGHRFLADDPIELDRPADYEARLSEARVVVDPEKRRATIVEGIASAAAGVGGRPVPDPHVLGEVINLVEEPRVVAGHFDEAFLKVPRVVTVTAMESHQRYFPVEDAEGRLLPNFIVVHNGDPGSDSRIAHGHDRVLRARLADAEFFFKEDTKTALAGKIDKLRGVVFQEKLGTVYDKTRRVAALAEMMARTVGLDDAARARLTRAAELFKADLVTNMVVEFPELQGAIGKEYALVDGEDAETATAIFEHYLPRYAGDTLPGTTAGGMLAIADKIDTITGCFAVGLIPTGSQDPYSLRRQARGVVAILHEGGLPLFVGDLLDEALDLYGAVLPELDRTATRLELDKFFDTRLRRYFGARGYDAEVVDAVLSIGVRQVGELAQRMEILERLRGKKQLDDVKIAFTRCKNLSQPRHGIDVDAGLFEAGEEQALFDACRRANDDLDRLVGEGKLGEAMTVLASLRPVIDRFFDEVLVMAPDPKVRDNRLKLLNLCLRASDRLADFSKLT